MKFTRSDNGKAEVEGEGYDYYTTFYWPFPVTIPNDVEVWKLESKGTGEYNTKLTLKEAPTEEFWYDGQHIIPELTPVLLSTKGSEADANVTVTKTFNIYLTNEIAPITDTGFTGTLMDTVIEGYNWQEMEHPNVFALGKRNGRVAFYWLKKNQNSANKCYFKIDEKSAAKGIVSIEFAKNVTGINEVTAATNDDTFYDLQGRKVAAPTHGIYIKNGKKYVVK